MIRRLLIRGAGVVGVLWGTATLAFVAVHAIPGDPVQILVGPRTVEPEVRDRITEQWGLDQPLLVQYVSYLARLVRGDLGESYILGRPVGEVIGAQLGPTVELAVAGMVVAVVVAVAGAVLTAGRPRAGAVGRTVELVTASTPEFWLGILLLALFSFTWPLFPVAGAGDLRALVLPAVALGLGTGAVLAQVLREGMEDALAQPFALTARARGAGEWTLRVRHTLRVASVAPLALAGFAFGNLLGGAVIVEQVFGRPGLGQVALRAIGARDLPTILGVALLAGAAFVAVTVVVELVTLAVDPRLRIAAAPA